MLTQPNAHQPKPGRHAVLLAAAIAAVFGVAITPVFAGPPAGAFFQTRQGEGPGLSAQQVADIDACFETARREAPGLVVDTTARIEADGSGAVVSASVPASNSPTFQRCMEEKALSWKVPTPPGAPQPPPAGARLHLVFPIQLPKR